MEFARDSACIVLRSTWPYLLSVKFIIGSSKRLLPIAGPWLTIWLERFRAPKLGRKRPPLAGMASNSGFLRNCEAEGFCW